MKRLIGMALLLGVLVSPIGPTGCTQADIDGMKQDLGLLKEQVGPIEQALEQVIEQKAALDLKITTMEPGEEKDEAIAVSDSMGHVIDVSREVLAKGKEAIAGLQQRLATAEDEIDVVEATAKTVTPFLPPPWNAVAYAGIGLGVGLWRAAKNLKTGRKVAESVNPVMADALAKDPKLAAAVRIAQGTDGKRLVDEAQGKTRLKLPF